MTIRNALLLAAAFIALTFAAIWASKAGYIGDDTAKRVTQIACGLVVVYYANLVPKTLEPMGARCSPSRVQAVQRFSGWTLVLAGLGYSLVWLLLPIGAARPVSMALLATGVLLVSARLLWTLRRRGGDQSSAGP